MPEQADLFAHNDIVIAAPPGKIWEHLIHATAWPDWYSNARNVTVNAPSRLLGAGVTFDWITFGAHIHSTVHEFEPTARIGWYGETDQWLAYHTWLLEPRDDRTTYVVMEETGTGAQPEETRQLQSRPHAPRSRPVEHQPQVPLRKHPGLAASERQHPVGLDYSIWLAGGLRSSLDALLRSLTWWCATGSSPHPPPQINLAERQIRRKQVFDGLISQYQIAA